MADLSHYAIPDPEFVNALAQTPPPFASPSADALQGDEEVKRRQKIVAEMLRAAVAAFNPPQGVIVEEKRIPVTSPPGDIAVRVYTPEPRDTSETFAVYVDFHGSGYSVGTLDSDELDCRALSVKNRIVVVNVDYRLAPQFPWPTGPNDAYDAVKWVARDSTELRVDLKKGFIIGGTSAGGNFTCTVAQRAREDPELQGKITGQVLQSPETVTHSKEFPESLKDKLKSYEQFKSDPILTRENIALFMGAYKPGNQFDPLVSPILAKSLAGLPPAYVQIAGADPLRDEGLLYAQMMQESGVQTKVDVYPGVPHGFAAFYPKLAISAKWRTDLDTGVQWLLGFSKA
ncbi:uncharacterized protein FOMMEDRAFT_144445 [Fomitiporia mediterranea MF3/22]|uniref:uncharacterized protein n=1 Tax=Fomitiporia mediterranea (strain MF3/22) TaxID=694068 RepID=UPI0004407463|nr:uncharacterized protein FOMMEDRAFT_144445 [Fomitiporia mediterranea MF3/22]EJD06347.1 hypothetical protein FOMMEDRAFT_144445 [Fomitiporia mediterranea MF3/22]